MIGIAGTVLAGIGGQCASAWLEDRRATRARQATWVDETRVALQEASSEFLEAQLELNRQIIRPGSHALDSHALFGPLLKHEGAMALRLGASHPAAEVFSEAVAKLAVVENLIALGQTGGEAVADSNEAYDLHKRFLDLAAPLVRPMASPKGQDSGG